MAPPRPRGPWALALHARLRAYERRLAVQRELLDARMRVVEALSGRLDDRPARLWRGAVNGDAEDGEPSPPTRRELLGEIFARIPAGQLDANGYPALTYVNALLEYEGQKPLESMTKLTAEYARWEDADANGAGPLGPAYSNGSGASADRSGAQDAGAGWPAF